MADYLSGEILTFDKPYGWTSFDVVNKVRRAVCLHTGQKRIKVGHAGTLDPLATGLMIVCTGKQTKQIEQLQSQTKEYVATLRLGATTPSFDREHEIDAYYPTGHLDQSSIEQALRQFVGEIWQTPPAYSAIKVDGKRAYDYARTNQAVDMKAKQLVIDQIELIECHAAPELTADREQAIRIGRKAQQQASANPADMVDRPAGVQYTPWLATIRVVCSKGTYIRALARDIGEALHTGAYLTELRRTRIGTFDVSDSMRVNDFVTSLQQEEK